MDKDEANREDSAKALAAEEEPVVEVEAMLPPDAPEESDVEALPGFDAYDDVETDVKSRKVNRVALPEADADGDFSLTKESVTSPEPQSLDADTDPPTEPITDGPDLDPQEPAPLPDAPVVGTGTVAGPGEDPFLLDPWPDAERTQTLQRRRLSRVDAFAEYRDHLHFLDSAAPPPQVLDPQPSPEAEPEPAPERIP